MTSRTKKGMATMNTQSKTLGIVRRILKAFLPLLFLIAGAISADIARAENPNDILVIANLGVKANSVALDELKDMFLKKKTSWGSGDKVIPLNVSDNPKLRDEFRAAVLKMSSTEEQRYWQARKIKEGDSEPTAFGNIQKAVFKLSGSVSYVYRSQYKTGVAKIVLVVPAGK
jgi:hypothetical protein